MERLQEAMERARARRESAAQGSDTDTAARAPLPHEPRREESSERTRPDTAGWDTVARLEPNERLLKANRVVAFFGGKPAAAIDMLRTKILKQCGANNWKRVVVTSPTQACGKTTIVANLAFSLARQTELRVLVIEVDMRRPELAAVLGVQDNLAFATYMSGDDPSFMPHLVAYGDNLVFACNTVPAANPSELLHSAGARERLDRLEEAFRPDLVLFDAPPILNSDDTIAFLDYADCAVIVAAAEQNTIKHIDVAETEVAGATSVLGVVMNKSRYLSDQEGYDSAYY